MSKKTILLTSNILQLSTKDFLLHKHGIALRVFVSSNPLWHLTKTWSVIGVTVNRPFHSEYLADICSIRVLSDNAMTPSPAPTCSGLFVTGSVDAKLLLSCFMAKLKTIEANSVRSSLSAMVIPVLLRFCPEISTIIHPPKEASSVKYLV